MSTRLCWWTITKNEPMADNKFKSVNVYPTMDTSLPWFDNTKLVAINTCPTWGIVRYTLNKSMMGAGRAMALEAGGAAHEVFAAHRLFHLIHSEDEVTRSMVPAVGERVFGKQRYEQMIEAIDPREDLRTQRNQFALSALYNSGFYDDPADKRRTTTNIEEMCIAYMDRFDWTKQLPAVLADRNFVGIEVPVDVTIEYTLMDDSKVKYRFVGKADGVHWKDDKQDTLRVHENKTASRLGDAWEMSWETNHQPTGYMIALSAMLNIQIRDSLMLGSCLPMPKSYAINGLSRVPVTRQDFQIIEWFEWFLHTVQLHDQYKDSPLHAPMYTHSCNRYFRPCSFITLCASEPEERQQILDEMAIIKWSPLEDEEGSAD